MAQNPEGQLVLSYGNRLKIQMARTSAQTGAVGSASSLNGDSRRPEHKVEVDTPPGFIADLPRYEGTYDTFGDEAFYRPIDSYEGRHRYDPKFQWGPHEEKKLIRKVSPNLTIAIPSSFVKY